MKKHNTKPQVNVGENKRQLLRLSSVNATCFIKYCLPCGVFFMFTSHSLLVGYSFPKRLLTIFSTPNNQLSILQHWGGSRISKRGVRTNGSPKTNPSGGPGAYSPEKFWNLSPQKCDFQRIKGWWWTVYYLNKPSLIKAILLNKDYV